MRINGGETINNTVKAEVPNWSVRSQVLTLSLFAKTLNNPISSQDLLSSSFHHISFTFFFSSDLHCSFFVISSGRSSLSPLKTAAMSYPTLPTNLPPATPQKPLPGAYFQTPAPATARPLPPNLPLQTQPQTPMPKLPPAASKTKNQTVSTEERGARTINSSLQSESRYPDLDSYLSREIPQLRLSEARLTKNRGLLV